MRIANKISLFVIPLIIVPLTIIGYFSYKTLIAGFNEQLYLEHQQLCYTGATRVEQVLDECRNELVLLTSLIKQQLKKHKYDLKGLIESNERTAQEFANGMALRFSPFVTIRFLEANGDEVFITNGLESKFKLSNVRDNPIFLQAVSVTIGLSIPSQFPVSTTKHGESLTTLTVPFYDDSRLVAFIFLEMNVRIFTRMLSELAESTNGHYMLFDGLGRIIADGVNPISFLNENMLTLYNSSLEQVVRNPKISFSQDEMSVDGKKFYISTRPVKEYIAFKEPVPEERWYIAIIRTESSLLAAFRKSQTVFFTVLFAGLIFAFLGTIFISKKITTPIDYLTATAKSFAEGNLDSRVNIQSGDEIGELASGFNRMAADLKQLIRDRQVNESLIAVGKFSTVLAHDLRNPVEGIKLLSIELGKRIGENDPEYEYVSAIKQSVDYLSNLVNQSLDFAKPTEPKLIKSDLIALVNTVLSEFQFNSVELVKNYPDKLPLVNLDEVQFQRVVSNLIQNAIDASLSKKSSKANKITVSIKKSSNVIGLEIADAGSGISEEIKEKIFDPFYTTKPKGHGLGLALARQIVKSHGGTISFKTNVGIGTQFLIELPLL